MASDSVEGKIICHVEASSNPRRRDLFDVHRNRPSRANGRMDATTDRIRGLGPAFGWVVFSRKGRGASHQFGQNVPSEILEN